ncbi:hypothetical protein C6500_03930 [Candidatus Poribacteria bacterium]|nr:MAG: hypothetical protein C6500_03930 [Candidatus Poribacteria bacterium]
MNSISYTELEQIMQQPNRQKLLQKKADHILKQAIQPDLPLGYKCESTFTTEDRSYTVQVRFVDLQTIISGVQHSYSKPDRLIKYSKAEHSPVSSKSADFLKLATPLYYRELEVETNSELIADDLESTYIKHGNWNDEERAVIKRVEKSVTKNLLSFRTNTTFCFRIEVNNFCMYCTSIDPGLSYEREKQMKNLSLDYDCMTKIEKPPEFAEQLGRDVGKHISLQNDLEIDFSQAPILHTLGSFHRKLTAGMGEYLVLVDHGPVIYLDESEIVEVVKEDSEANGANIIPFVKRGKYQEQQEYRFLVRVHGLIIDKTEFYLKVSDELRKLMSREI